MAETYFDSSVQEGGKNIQLDGYNMIRADHPSNAKRGGVCIFYVEILGIHIVNPLMSTLILINVVFVKSLYKIARVILALCVGSKPKCF